MSDQRRLLVLTGASGFLGSALLIELAKNYRVLAIDHREPGAAMRNAAPEARFEILDISLEKELKRVMAAEAERCGGLDYVVHFAAFYHFDLDNRPEYQRSNIQGTRAVVNAAAELGAKRLIFASSLAGVALPDDGRALTEQSAMGGIIPYGKSKEEGEAILHAAADRLPSVALRIGAVYSDWCELPLLWSLLKLWGGNSLFARVMPGRGRTGMPYIHRDDLVRIVARILACSDQLGRSETFLASPEGCVNHNELFTAIQTLKRGPESSGSKPLYLPKWIAKAGLHAQWMLGRLTGNYPYERPWMLDYLDKPMISDTRLTRAKLSWDTTPGLSVLARLPVLYERFKTQRSKWEERNLRRVDGRYLFDADG